MEEDIKFSGSTGDESNENDQEADQPDIYNIWLKPAIKHNYP